MSVILEGRDITRDYIVSGGFLRGAKTIRALHGISFSLEQGKTLAIVGESGCGKSTLARILTLIDPANSGDLYIQGEKIDIKETKVTSELRAKVQIVFQNPYSSLNPRQKVGEVLTEPLIINTDIPAKERRKRAEEMLEKVGLERQHYNRYPHMFSGGQRQRIAIARALMLNPQILVLDEPVSALDLSVQAQVLNLLKDLQDEFDLSYIFVSHDLSVVRYFADEVMVMNAGEVVEYASRDQIFANPQHEYTKTLLAATPIADVEKIRERVERRKAFLAAAET
ncbi:MULTISPECIES: dipeptide ABC transporter ATP-binding protein [Thioclava]|uniref:Peptide ABC transporter ATP-binding protein n=1 Tax=Thioclava nitratireducens TaxID=1915078 RepID=A0ABN4X8R0_9RHOB|nr:MULTISPECIES: dipeptide ABC transporter ATP-binding protein [Thioclava]AQS48425.1 peptide ABC transporter ATP-binding protein [Thioclava nitratireducens]OWY04828.1 peptide ABC transporter ATP-binding protein [Thioclava sp. F1Mire-8]OWY06445.1 peptide ABC transporter ATP-binding protein [Thioclava sp. IC9]OWY08054.1 peptide ABC transporter ATP-binding protein [Thioclava sp. F42-5]OWY15207.1 peptide ABC transporter ATP-binding protein [Thioclava sp. F34-6]